MVRVENNGLVFEYDINTEDGRKQLIETVLILYRNKFPFFINMLLFICDIMDVEEKEKDQIAYTKLNANKERIDLFINFKLIEEKKLEPIDILGILFHEFFHNYFYHFDRFKTEYEEGYDEALNVAMDYYVNSSVNELLSGENRNYSSNWVGKLEEKLNVNVPPQEQYELVCYESIKKFCDFHKLGLPDEDVVRNKWIDRDLFEFIKQIIPKSTKITFRVGPGNGSPQPGSNPGRTLDDHSKSMEDESGNSQGQGKDGKDGKGLDDSAIRDIIRSKIEVAEGEMQQYLDSGDGVGREAGIFNRKRDMLKPNYFLNTLKLKRVITKALACGKSPTYQKPNRKRQGTNIVFKGKKKDNGLKLVVGIDVSGSVSDKELQQMLDMLYGLNKKKKEFLFDIIYWSDNDIKENKTFTDNVSDIREFAKKGAYSTGGTDISTFHQYLEEKYSTTPFEVINITDGYFSYDKKIPDTLQKYHFVLTESCRPEFKNAYSDSRFTITEIKQQDYK